jgi:hypothetical protein
MTTALANDSRTHRDDDKRKKNEQWSNGSAANENDELR